MMPDRQIASRTGLSSGCGNGERSEPSCRQIPQSGEQVSGDEQLAGRVGGGVGCAAVRTQRPDMRHHKPFRCVRKNVLQVASSRRSIEIGGTYL